MHGGFIIAATMPFASAHLALGTDVCTCLLALRFTRALRDACVCLSPDGYRHVSAAHSEAVMVAWTTQPLLMHVLTF